MSYGDDARRKRIALISFSSIFLIAMVVAVTVGVSLKKNDSSDSKNDSTSHEVSTSMKAIQSICAPTNYKQECVSSLSSEAGNTTDPKELIKAAFKVAMKQISEGAKRSTLLKELEKDPRTKRALEDCKQLMDFAVGELEHSFGRFGEFDISKLDEMLIDLRIWLSAVITYQETCVDGFQNTSSNAGDKMKAALKTSMQLSSNGLAIVSELSSVLKDLQIPGIGRRRLLGEAVLPVLGHDESIPDHWSNPGVRRLLQASSADTKPDVVVAKDGSGKFKTINEALLQIPKLNSKPFVIYIKAGVYKEYVHITRDMTHVVLTGDGATKTRITGNKNFVDGIPIFETATVSVSGDYFVAKNIGFENSAGAEKHQASALKVESDFSTFYNCSMEGYQSTLYVHAKRQFYRDCTVSGTIDFVFGDAAAVFQNCKFVVRKPMETQQCVVTAQARKDRRQASAIILQGGSITADPAFYPLRFELGAYLGRPAKEYSRTIIMETHIDDLIKPEGWVPWLGTFGTNTCYFAEFHNKGPGAATAGRVKWAGIKHITRENALDFTPGKFILGDGWIKETQVPYVPGLIGH